MKRHVLAAVAAAGLACFAAAGEWVFQRETKSAVAYSFTLAEWSNWQVAAVRARNLAGTGTVDTVVSVTYASGFTETLATLTNNVTWRPAAAVYLTKGDTLTVTGAPVWLTNGVVDIEYFSQRK